jgi:hypothetical protein
MTPVLEKFREDFMQLMNSNSISAWLITDMLFSKAFYGALNRVLEQDKVSDDIREFIQLIAVPPWVLESIVNTAIVRWFHLLGTPDNREIASFLARSYLESSDFFGDDIAGSIRAEFSRIIVEVAALLFTQPHPSSQWN